MYPEFFDIFGFIGFLFITVITLWSLFRGKSMPRWAIVILAVIGIIGLCVDGTIIFLYYFA